MLSCNHHCRGEKKKVLCISSVKAFCSLSYSACKAYTPSYVVCPAVSYFSTLSYIKHDFGEKVIEHKMCGWIFSTTFIWNIFHSKKNSARHHIPGCW